jgi:putative phosphoesterase
VVGGLIMKIGVLSDSHNNLSYLKEAASWLIEEKRVDLLVHLGDDMEDARILEEFGVRVLKVPGVFEAYYQDPGVKNRIVEEFEGKKILLSHTEEVHRNDPPPHVKELIRPEELVLKKEVDIALFGHTHIPKIEEKGGVLILNPGHLKLEDKKGYAPSFGIVDLHGRTLEVITLEKKVVIIKRSF